MFHKHQIAPAAVVCALALGGLSQPAAAAEPISDNLVKIGVLNDQSGIYADMAGPGSTIAARMAVEDFGRTVLGKPIEIIFGDHQNKPDVGSALVSRWIDQEKLDTVVDIPTLRSSWQSRRSAGRRTGW
jgi:branched-chain amino acid transport system substrate-binding protein